MIKVIPLDLAVIEVPVDVIHSMVEDNIREEYKAHKHYNVPIMPDTLRAHVDMYAEGAGYDWQHRLLQAAESMTVEQQEQWLRVMPGGFFRAEFRAYLKKRKTAALTPAEQSLGSSML